MVCAAGSARDATLSNDAGAGSTDIYIALLEARSQQNAELQHKSSRQESRAHCCNQAANIAGY